MASSLLPELWEKVFDRVKDAKDFQSILHCNPEWNSLMSYKKTTRLFPLVYPILVKEVPELKVLQNMLSLRQVHPNWKEAVDTELERDPEPYVDRKYTFIFPCDIERLTAHIDSLPQWGNPFLGRYLDSFNLEESFLSMLEKHGSKLKTVRLWTGTSLLLLGRTLQLLPNLETLTMATVFGIEHNWLSESPFPPLPRLTDLNTGALFANVADDGRNATELLKTVLKAYGTGLKGLTCGEQLFRVIGISRLLPNLVDLCIFDASNFTQRDFQVMSQVGWRLKTLTLHMRGAGRKAHSLGASSGVITALNSFSTTLEYLQINVKLEPSFDPSSILVFPRLKGVILGVLTPVIQIPAETLARLSSLPRLCSNLEQCGVAFEEGSPFLERKDSRRILRGMFPKLKECDVLRWC